MNKYSVKFFVKAMIEFEVRAETPEKAIEEASKLAKNNIFAKKVSILDENTELVGYDNNDLWGEMS